MHAWQSLLNNLWPSILVDIPLVPLNPCQPSPCGANAMCREISGSASCTCLPDFYGNPYEGCRPECVINSDCTANRACIRNRCQDPCPGTCGVNAICEVINHIPACSCQPRYTGDPFRYCEQEIRKWIQAPVINCLRKRVISRVFWSISYSSGACRRSLSTVTVRSE